MIRPALIPVAALLAAALASGCAPLSVSRRPLSMDALRSADPAAAQAALTVTETRAGYGRVQGEWRNLRDLKRAAVAVQADDARRAYNAANTQRILRNVLPPVSVAAGTGVGLLFALLTALDDGPRNTQAPGAMLAGGFAAGVLAAGIEWPLLNAAVARNTRRGAELYNERLARTLKLGAAPRKDGLQAALSLTF